MTDPFRQWIRRLRDRVRDSIATYPLLIAIMYFFAAVISLYLESRGLTRWAGQHLPDFVLIKSWGVASAILTVLIGALISLMVFSFSQVMVLLNNAASNFSPRILPNLISNRFHQFVLGTYLGTITFQVVLAVNITPDSEAAPIPGFSILIGILLGLYCLLLFIFFIHSISESVQVGHVLESIYQQTERRMESGRMNKMSDEPLPDNADDWPVTVSDYSGYLRSIDTSHLTSLCAEHGLKLRVRVPEGQFVMKDAPLFSCDQALDDELAEEIANQFDLSFSEVSDDDYVIGLKRITEIALKAMSPGINDPGTALSAIDYLTMLFAKQMELPDSGALPVEYDDGDAQPGIWLRVVSFDTLFLQVLASLRQYSRHDSIVMLKLVNMLRFLYTRAHCSEDQRKTIVREAKILREDAREHLSNPADFERIENLLASFGEYATQSQQT